MKLAQITLGGWYQRTTLHLTEVHDLFFRGYSKLDLNQKKLTKLQNGLQLVSVERQATSLEYISAQTKNGIDIRYYEDGLYTLTLPAVHIKRDSTKLLDYYQTRLKPALDYIFSLGAPTPKVLANIKSVPPLAVIITASKPDRLKNQIQKQAGPVYSHISAKSITVYKTPRHIVVAATKDSPQLDSLVDNQLFFREFKDQLEKYLNIHRQVWEEISQVKERKNITGTQIAPLRDQLDSYRNTIELIENRLNQMSTYVRTRASIAKNSGVEEQLNALFQYKFETLSDTHAYIKDIWRMTHHYLGAALKVLDNLHAESTKNSIRSLQLITAIGVTAGIVRYLSTKKLPQVTLVGLGYFGLLLAVTWVINQLIVALFTRSKYRIKFTQTKKI